MTDVRCAATPFNGVFVLETPAEIDITTADQLHAALLHAIRDAHQVVVVDMTSTHFCDAAGLHTLIAAHNRAQAEGGGLRLVVPAEGAVWRVFSLTGMCRFVPCFASLEEALAPAPDGTNLQPVRPGPDTGQDQI